MREPVAAIIGKIILMQSKLDPRYQARSRPRSRLAAPDFIDAEVATVGRLARGAGGETALESGTFPQHRLHQA
jgi:hypothetical protein